MAQNSYFPALCGGEKGRKSKPILNKLAIYARDPIPIFLMYFVLLLVLRGYFSVDKLGIDLLCWQNKKPCIVAIMKYL